MPPVTCWAKWCVTMWAMYLTRPTQWFARFRRCGFRQQEFKPHLPLSSSDGPTLGRPRMTVVEVVRHRPLQGRRSGPDRSNNIQRNDYEIARTQLCSAAVRDQPELQRRLIGTIIPDFDAIADDHGLDTAIGRSAALPMIIRLRPLAGLAAVIKNPLAHLSCVNRERSGRRPEASRPRPGARKRQRGTGRIAGRRSTFRVGACGSRAIGDQRAPLMSSRPRAFPRRVSSSRRWPLSGRRGASCPLL